MKKTTQELETAIAEREREQRRVQKRINLLVKLGSDLTPPKFRRWHEFWKHKFGYCPKCGLKLMGCSISSLDEVQNLYTCKCGYEWAVKFTPANYSAG